LLVFRAWRREEEGTWVPVMPRIVIVFCGWDIFWIGLLFVVWLEVNDTKCFTDWLRAYFYICSFVCVL
jgi:hypothetical protein